MLVGEAGPLLSWLPALPYLARARSWCGWLCGPELRGTGSSPWWTGPSSGVAGSQPRGPRVHSARWWVHLGPHCSWLLGWGVSLDCLLVDGLAPGANRLEVGIQNGTDSISVLVVE